MSSLGQPNSPHPASDYLEDSDDNEDFLSFFTGAKPAAASDADHAEEDEENDDEDDETEDEKFRRFERETRQYAQAQQAQFEKQQREMAGHPHPKTQDQDSHEEQSGFSKMMTALGATWIGATLGMAGLQFVAHHIYVARDLIIKRQAPPGLWIYVSQLNNRVCTTSFNFGNACSAIMVSFMLVKFGASWWTGADYQHPYLNEASGILIGTLTGLRYYSSQRFLTGFNGPKRLLTLLPFPVLGWASGLVVSAYYPYANRTPYAHKLIQRNRDRLPEPIRAVLPQFPCAFWPWPVATVRAPLAFRKS